MDEQFRLISATIMALVSSVGILVNAYVFRALFQRKKNMTIFYKLCVSKTVCNLVTCLAFGLWAAPCTFLNFYYLPRFINILWGQIAGWGAYTTGICLQLCLSLNRLTVTYFPFSSKGAWKKNSLSVFIPSVFALATVYGLPKGCGYIYSIELVSWLPEDSECAMRHADQMFYFIVAVSIVSNSCNFATFVKLVKTNLKPNGAWKQGSRLKKSRLMFAQSVTQDCLHVIDMLACQILYKLDDAAWFQFICMSVVWLTIHVFDGFVMLVYNREIQPKFVRKRRPSRTEAAAAVSSIIIASRVF